MNRPKIFSVYILLAAVFPAAADSIVSVSASLGSNVCSQTAMEVAYCNLSGTASSPGSADTSATAYPPYPVAAYGFVDISVFATGTNASASAGINEMNFIRVNGVTGSGSVQATFSGYGGTYLNIPGTASLSPVSVTIGSSSAAFTLLSTNTYNLYPVVAPINFGALTPLNFSLTESVSSTVYNSGPSNSGFVNLFGPTFTVFDANGHVLPNASVEVYIPEPASWGFVVMGLTALVLARRRVRQQA